jgi:hypothetical protein
MFNPQMDLPEAATYTAHLMHVAQSYYLLIAGPACLETPENEPCPPGPASAR